MRQIFDLFGEKKHPKTSYCRRIIALFKEIGVAESNNDVKEFCSEIVVFAHAQWKYSQNTV